MTPPKHLVQRWNAWGALHAVAESLAEPGPVAYDDQGLYRWAKFPELVHTLPWDRPDLEWYLWNHLGLRVVWGRHVLQAPLGPSLVVHNGFVLEDWAGHVRDGHPVVVHPDEYSDDVELHALLELRRPWFQVYVLNSDATATPLPIAVPRCDRCDDDAEPVLSIPDIWVDKYQNLCASCCGRGRALQHKVAPC